MNQLDPTTEDTASQEGPRAKATSLSSKKASTGRSLFKSSAVVGAMTMLSRVFGLLRDIVLARVLGASAEADAFFVAFKIPNFFRRLFAEGAFSQAFVPVLSEYRQSGTQAAALLLVAKVAGNLGSILLTLTIVVVLASPMLTALFGMGFLISGDQASFWLTSDLLRITFPYLFFISMTGLCSAVLNCYDRFAAPAFTPVLLNIALICAALFLAPLLGSSSRSVVFALAWGVFIAGCIQLAFQLPFMARIHMLARPTVDWHDPGVKKILTLMVPALFGVSIAQINLLLDTIIATFLPAGSVSWLYFSDRLTELPLGVFGVGIATVVLPALSRSYVSSRDNHDGRDSREEASEDERLSSSASINTAFKDSRAEDDSSKDLQSSETSHNHFSETLNWALKLIVLIGVPATTALIIIAEPVLILLFYYDAMELSDIAMSSYSLRAYAIGLTAFMAIKVLASGFYARQDMKTPVKIGIIALVLNMLLNLCFVLPLYYWYQIGHVGLALATSCSALINAVLLARALIKADAFAPANWLKFLWQLFVGCLLMGCVLHLLASTMTDLATLSMLSRFLNVLMLLTAGAVMFASGLFMAGFRVHNLRPPSSSSPVV